MVITLLTDKAKLPLDLLLEADPDLEKVKKYSETETVFVAKLESEVVGVLVLEHREGVTEILNISIAKNWQNQGLGKKMIQHAIQATQRQGNRKLLVATGNSSIGQLAFYQKCGFEMVKIIRNYFTDNYEMPIFENGIECKHQLILAYYF